MSQYPSVAQKLILRFQDKILVLKHPSGVISFPGGKIEFGESLFDALNRELKEELAFTLDSMPGLFNVWNYISIDKMTHSVFIYYIHDLQAPIDFSSPEKLEILWLSKQNMINVNLIKDCKFLDKMFDAKI